MQGFSNRFTDFPDYILGITKEIWEDRGIDTLHEYYSKDIVVRSPASVVVGNQDVIGATMATLAEFQIAASWAKMSFGPAHPKRACCPRTALSRPRRMAVRNNAIFQLLTGRRAINAGAGMRSTIRSMTNG